MTIVTITHELFKGRKNGAFIVYRMPKTDNQQADGKVLFAATDLYCHNIARATWDSSTFHHEGFFDDWTQQELNKHIRTEKGQRTLHTDLDTFLQLLMTVHSHYNGMTPCSFSFNPKFKTTVELDLELVVA